VPLGTFLTLRSGSVADGAGHHQQPPFAQTINAALREFCPLSPHGHQGIQRVSYSHPTAFAREHTNCNVAYPSVRGGVYFNSTEWSLRSNESITAPSPDGPA
jgi:hypothetical protein